MVRYSASGGEVIRQNENPARVRGSGQGLGNPHLVGVRRAMLRGLRFGKRTGALEVPHATSGTKSARRVTAVLAGGPGRFRLRHPRAAHGWVAHRLNCLEFTNAEANGARRYSSPFLLPHSSSVSASWLVHPRHLEPIGRAAYRFLLEGMNPAGLGTIAAHLNCASHASKA
jgi:hypothetical protein